MRAGGRPGKHAAPAPKEERRMGFMASGIFWGVLLVLWGATLIVNTVFHLNVPFFRVAIALIVIYVGIRMLMAGGLFKTKKEVVFAESSFSGEKVMDEYSIVFGKGRVDLSGAVLEKDRTTVGINVVFGNAVLKVSPKQAVRISADSVFGSVKLPDNRETAFGETSYETRKAREGEKVLEVRAEVVFGRLEVVTE